ncbi:hypothetical protein I552_1518 [Mycobacterium xenopi 3993]|nr:hypothetical protein I552_1518 [Mycobacterium xenopi 3993]
MAAVQPAPASRAGAPVDTGVVSAAQLGGTDNPPTAEA